MDKIEMNPGISMLVSNSQNTEATSIIDYLPAAEKVICWLLAERERRVYRIIKI